MRTARHMCSPGRLCRFLWASRKKASRDTWPNAKQRTGLSDRLLIVGPKGLKEKFRGIGGWVWQRVGRPGKKSVGDDVLFGFSKQKRNPGSMKNVPQERIGGLWSRCKSFSGPIPTGAMLLQPGRSDTKPVRAPPKSVQEVPGQVRLGTRTIFVKILRPRCTRSHGAPACFSLASTQAARPSNAWHRLHSSVGRPKRDARSRRPAHVIPRGFAVMRPFVDPQQGSGTPLIRSPIPATDRPFRYATAGTASARPAAAGAQQPHAPAPGGRARLRAPAAEARPLTPTEPKRTRVTCHVFLREGKSCPPPSPTKRSALLQCHRPLQRRPARTKQHLDDFPLHRMCGPCGLHAPQQRGPSQPRNQNGCGRPSTLVRRWHGDKRLLKGKWRRLEGNSGGPSGTSRMQVSRGSASIWKTAQPGRSTYNRTERHTASIKVEGVGGGPGVRATYSIRDRPRRSCGVPPTNPLCSASHNMTGGLSRAVR